MATAKATVKVQGLRELLSALSDLPKATSRNVQRRAMLKALMPMERQAEALAPALTGELRRSIEISTKLSKRQQSEHRSTIGMKGFRTSEGFRYNPQTALYLFMGPSASAKSIVQEFGSVYLAPQPFMRPAWDAGAGPAVETIKDELWSEIGKAAARLARKAAKLKV